MNISMFEQAIGMRKISSKDKTCNFNDGNQIVIAQCYSGKKHNSNATFNMLVALNELGLAQYADNGLQSVSTIHNVNKLFNSGTTHLLLLHAHDKSFVDKVTNKVPSLAKLTKQQQENSLIISVEIPDDATDIEQAELAFNAVYNTFGHPDVTAVRNKDGSFSPLQIDEVFESDFE